MNVQGRKRTLTFGLGGAIVLALAAWIIGGQIRSPAQIAAETSAPDPSAITVPVEQRVLSSEVIVRGTVRYGSPQPVVLATSESKQSSAPPAPRTSSRPRRAAAQGRRGLGRDVGLRAPGFVAAWRTGVPPRPGPRQPRARRASARERAQRAWVSLPGKIDGRYDGETACRRRLLLREAGLGAVRAHQRAARPAARCAAAAAARRETRTCKAAS